MEVNRMEHCRHFCLKAWRLYNSTLSAKVCFKQELHFPDLRRPASLLLVAHVHAEFEESEKVYNLINFFLFL